MCGKFKNKPSPLGGNGGVDNIEPLMSVMILSAVDDDTVPIVGNKEWMYL